MSPVDYREILLKKFKIISNNLLSDPHHLDPPNNV